MPVTQHVAEMIAAARLLIDRVSVHEAAELQRLDAAILIDLCDVRELQKLGTVANSFHAPRGLLEFWADPDSPYHKPIFRTDKKLILFCASGLRSALAVRTLQEMGMKNVLDMEGGFTEWRMQDLRRLSELNDRKISRRPAPQSGASRSCRGGCRDLSAHPATQDGR